MGTGISDIFLTGLRLARGATADAARARESARAQNVLPAAGLGGETARLFHYRQETSLVSSLTDRLRRFATALDGFSWPADTTPWSRARLVIHGGGSADAVQAEAVATGTAVPFYKYFSDPKASLTKDSDIEPGRYALRLAQGTQSRTITVDVADGDTGGDVLGTVKNAVNAADLTVRADILRQQAPFRLDPSLAGAGYVLALSVNPARTDQTVTITDATGHLASRLGLTATTPAAGPADIGATQVKVLQTAATTTVTSSLKDPGAASALAVGRHDFAVAVESDAGDAQPTTYLSSVLDPDAAAALAPGTYTFAVAYAGQTRELSVTVRSGWTVGDVMRGVSAALSGQGTMDSGGRRINAPSFAIPGISVSQDDAAIPSAATAWATTPGQMLTVSAQATDAQNALRLTDGAGGVLASLGLTTALRGTPVSVTVQAGDTNQDVADSVARAAAMTSTRFAASVRNERWPSYALTGKRLSTDAVAVSLSLADKKISQTLTLTDGATGILASLPLTRLTPGPDGAITVSGARLTSENDVYSLEQGRLLATATREDPVELPLRVAAGMKRVEEETSGVVSAYNDVMRLAARNQDLLDASLRNRLEAPVAANLSGLSRLGMSRSAATGELWINGETFWRTLSAEGPGARATLAEGDAALIPGWKLAVADILRVGADGFLLSGPVPGDRDERTMSEFDLDKKSRLVDLLG
jgi:hypothetical protein